MKPMTPRDIARLIEQQGDNFRAPKSKTWLKFDAYYKKNRMDVTTLANIIGIPISTMEKFMTGEYVIKPFHMRKIQEYLKSIGEM